MILVILGLEMLKGLEKVERVGNVGNVERVEGLMVAMPHGHDTAWPKKNGWIVGWLK
ncbi:MAG TPA: hypothetical protein VFG54_19500 [Prolixibacteraceae bacterium]|nr:hypothetical protein [Prolixibacteraceae bacterium]